MVERPILFSGPMVCAILNGQKTQTRRVVKPVRGFEHYNILKYGMPHAFDPWAVWWHGPETDCVGCLQECPHGKPGDRLWVRESTEAYQLPNILTGEPMGVLCGRYDADQERVLTSDGFDIAWWYSKPRCPSIHMPRWVSRLALEITDVRAQMVQDISEADAKAEGISVLPLQSEEDPSAWYQSAPGVHQGRTARASFFGLWDSINGAKHPSSSNPWVWVITFRVSHAA